MSDAVFRWLFIRDAQISDGEFWPGYRGRTNSLFCIFKDKKLQKKDTHTHTHRHGTSPNAHTLSEEESKWAKTSHFSDVSQHRQDVSAAFRTNRTRPSHDCGLCGDNQLPPLHSLFFMQSGSSSVRVKVVALAHAGSVSFLNTAFTQFSQSVYCYSDSLTQSC